MSENHPLFERYERKYRRGWKRQLAQDLHVAETNIHTWTTSGKMSAIVRTALDLQDELLDYRDQLARIESEITVLIDQDDGRHAIAQLDKLTGRYRIIAENICSLDLARAFAARASGEFQSALNQLGDDLHSLHEGEDDGIMTSFRLVEAADRGKTRREGIATMVADLEAIMGENAGHRDSSVLTLPKSGNDD